MLKIIIGAVLTGVGLFFIRESYGYGGEAIVLVFGVPLTIVGILLVLKGGKKYLSNQ